MFEAGLPELKKGLSYSKKKGKIVGINGQVKVPDVPKLYERLYFSFHGQSPLLVIEEAQSWRDRIVLEHYCSLEDYFKPSKSNRFKKDLPELSKGLTYKINAKTGKLTSIRTYVPVLNGSKDDAIMREVPCSIGHPYDLDKVIHAIAKAKEIREEDGITVWGDQWEQVKHRAKQTLKDKTRRTPMLAKQFVIPGVSYYAQKGGSQGYHASWSEHGTEKLHFHIFGQINLQIDALSRAIEQRRQMELEFYEPLKGKQSLYRMCDLYGNTLYWLAHEISKIKSGSIFEFNGKKWACELVIPWSHPVTYVVSQLSDNASWRRFKIS